MRVSLKPTPCWDLNVKCGYITEGQESAHSEHFQRKGQKEDVNKDLQDLKGLRLAALRLAQG